MQKEDNNNDLKIDWGNWGGEKQTTPSTPEWETVSDNAKTSNSDFKKSDNEFLPQPKEDRDPTPEEMDLWKVNSSSDYSYLGVIKTIEINPELYSLGFDNQKAMDEMDFTQLEKIDDDGKFKLNSAPNTELTNIMATISNIGKNKGINLSNFYIVNSKPHESVLNIFRGNSLMHFIYIVQGNKDSGNIVLDLSSINGPTQKIMDTHEGMLILFEGWIPYSITKNVSDKQLIAIAGTFE